MGLNSKIKRTLKARKSSKTPWLSLSKKLFLIVVSIYLVFVLSFTLYQYQREKEYKIDILHTQLQETNQRINDFINSDQRSFKKISQFEDRHNKNLKRELRISIFSLSGEVIYDSFQQKKESILPSHLNRKEIQQALKEGLGYDVRRVSETTGQTYFYSATRFDNYLIRSAQPYTLTLLNALKTDNHFLWFALVVSLILLTIFYTLTSKISKSIHQLRDFAMRADKGLPIGISYFDSFPHNELGVISQHIIQIYRRLHQTKEALYIEREKLIAHLQTSHEGLGVFTAEKREIIVNNLFIQYSNQLSDKMLKHAEDVLKIEEFTPIREFIAKLQHSKGELKEERRFSFTILKNGKIFAVDTIVFQDRSFEISINDITQEEEQKRLKKQLTQNIAHELKTPVSSIQGYLETITSNPQLTTEQQNKFIERCYTQSIRLSHLLKDISVLTRIDEGENNIEFEKVKLGELVHEIVEDAKIIASSKGITIENQVPQLISIIGNYSLLYSIFRNLLDNALYYGGNNIDITISLFREDSKFYYFNFSDNGVGVDEQHLSRLFERFYRVDKGRSRKLGGTGLGLAIVKNAILVHKGSILAKKKFNGGLEFIFTLSKNSNS